MAWVIKYGINYVDTCHRCRCEFGYHENEIVNDKIKCPACGYFTTVRRKEVK